MLIQRVVIQGFKTFAKRTEFVFDPGITAVVGPNGSGKSNIVDAVRWCLGEQSFGLLRSKKTSDIIFSGSDKKARLGMAQVSLTLDNSGGEIPIAFAEVEISRRAYRDGSNEYLVNGQKVRLQDVTELLAQTGLGKRTYAVIGQGLIDRVLSLAPEERRSLFEEAAGIAGYQAKREASLKRLEATHLNLTRVRDITAELAPRLGTLKRQAERAREREQMAGDLRALLREWYGYAWHAAVTEVDERHADARILRNRLDDRQADLDHVARTVEALRAAIAARRAALAEQQHASSALQRAVEAVGRERAVAEERLRQLAERSNEAARERAALDAEVEALRTQQAAVQTELAQAQATLAARRAELAQTEAALNQRRRAQESLQRAVEQARAALAQVQQRATDALARRTQTAERLQALHQARQSLAAAQADAQADAAHAQERMAAAEVDLAAAEQEVAAAQAALAAAEQTRANLRTALDAAEQSRREADRTLDRTQTRHDLLKRLSSEGAGLASGVRAVLQANLPGILGPVASLLHVQPEHERAIEVALGGALQNLVAASWQCTQEAIDYLKRTQRGRATFLPLDRLQTGNPIPAPRIAGVLGNAADLVGCDPRAQAARDHLLNRTWIAADLSSARRALDALAAGPRPTVVTLEGEIVRPGGAVTGGSDGAGGRDDGSVLARERELRDLPALLARAQAQAADAAAACRTRAAQRAEAEAAQADHQQALAGQTHSERTRRAALEEARRSSDRAAQQLRFLAEQAASGEAEAEAHRRRLDELETLLTTLQAERTAAETALAQAEAAAHAGASDALLRELADRRAAEAAALGAQGSRTALAEQERRTLDAAEKQRAAKESRRAALEAESRTLAGQIEQMQAREQALLHELEAQQAALDPEERALAEQTDAEAEAAAEERRLQALQRQDESAWAEARLLLQRSEDAVAQLRLAIERDLALVAPPPNGESGEPDADAPQQPPAAAVEMQPPLLLDAFIEALPLREARPAGLEQEMAALRGRLARLVHINSDAPREYDEALARYEHLTSQARDLEAAAADLHTIIGELDGVMQAELQRTFRAVALHFEQEFRTLFNGGSAQLLLTDPESIATSGIEIVARPPGKRPQSLALLSGGERSLAACALIFAILRVSPTPFCVLDEVDAALDEANVDRFRLAVEALSEGTQFILVTHNRRTLEGANTIYGVTMGDDGVSKVISLRLEGDRMVHHRPPVADGNGSNGHADRAPLDAIEEVIGL